MATKVEIITVYDAEKAAEYGFFCYKSKPKSEGYRRKLAWLEQRFAEGLQIKIIRLLPYPTAGRRDRLATARA